MKPKVVAITSKKVARVPLGCNFFLADDIRIEQGGKTSLLGFYPDSVIVVPLAKDAKEPTKKKRFGLAGMAVLASFSDSYGAYDLDLELLGPRGERLAKSSGGKLIAIKRGSLNFVPRFSPMPIVGFGKYKLILKLNKKAYSFSFEVRRGEVDPMVRGDAVFTPMKNRSTKA